MMKHKYGRDFFDISKDPMSMDQASSIQADVLKFRSSLFFRQLFFRCLFILLFIGFLYLFFMPVHLLAIFDPWVGVSLSPYIPAMLAMLLVGIAGIFIEKIKIRIISCDRVINSFNKLPDQGYLSLLALVEEHADVSEIKEYLNKVSVERDFLYVGEANMLERYCVKYQQDAKKVQEAERIQKAKEIIFS